MNSPLPVIWWTPRLAHLLVAIFSSLLIALPGAADPPQDARPEASGIGPDGPVYPVSHFSIHYLEEHPEQPALEEFLPLTVRLGQKPTGFTSPNPTQPALSRSVGGPPRVAPELYHASAIGSIAEQILAAFHRLGFVGVYVVPHSSDLDLESERDLRRPGDTVLRFIVSLGRVRALRTMATGTHADEDWRIDNPVHKRIRRGSPIQPRALGRPGTSDLVQRRELEDYLFRLNRHPGRRVEAALSASDEGSGIDVGFQVNEAKPWFVYGQSSNTGTEQTNEWQQRYGFVHRQLTNRDDILSVEYLNQGFNDVNGIDAVYEAPWFGSERPRWARTGRNDPSWLERDDIPWIGSDRLRWHARGGWNRIETGGSGFLDRFKLEEWQVGAGLTFNAWQHRAFFLDLVGAMNVRHIDVFNEALGVRAVDYIAEPEVGFRIERIDDVSTLLGRFSYHTNLATTSSDKAQFFGRLNPDVNWHRLTWDFGVSHYLEPLLFPARWREPSTARSSTLAHELALGARGQYGFDYRLVPQLSQVVGGFFSVRGYPQSAATGDDVYMGSVEYRLHIPQLLPHRREPTKLPILGDLRIVPQQVYGQTDWDLVVRAFFDAGYTKFNNRPHKLRNSAGFPVLRRSEPPQTLLGAGVGLELRIFNNIRARADWGRALHKTSTVSAGHDEFHFLFSVLY